MKSTKHSGKATSEEKKVRHKYLTRYVEYITEFELEDAVIEYFKVAEMNGAPFSMSGMKAHLGLSHYRYLSMLGDNRFKEVLEMATRAIEAGIEDGYLTGTYNGNAANFALKNHFGWKDKQPELDPDTLKDVNKETMKKLMSKEDLQIMKEMYYKLKPKKLEG